MLFRLSLLVAVASMVAAQSTSSAGSSVHVIPAPQSSTSMTNTRPPTMTLPAPTITTATTLTGSAIDSTSPITTLPASMTTQTEYACPPVTLTLIGPTSSGASPRLTPSWSRVLPLGALLLFSYFILPVMGRFALSWAATSDDRVECGAALGNAPSGPIPGNYLADVADCQVVANRARDTRGYWETYDWSDNEVDEFVYLDGEKTCHFSIRHVNTKSTNDVRVGNADVEDYIQIALKYTTSDNKVAQGGTISCHNARDPISDELVEWRVWNAFKEDGGARPERSAWVMLAMIIASVFVSYWVYA